MVFRFNINGADLFVVAITTMFAARALWHNVKAARRGLEDFRPQAVRTAVAAAVYVVAYLVLMLTPVDRVTWSTTMIGVSWPVWAIVWSGPARWSIVEKVKVQRLMERVRGELGECPAPEVEGQGEPRRRRRRQAEVEGEGEGS